MTEAVSSVQRALIFQGRGALAAFEAGAFQAICHKIIKEDEIRGEKDRPLFDIVVGTSMGAVNAAILVNNVVNEKRKDPALSDAHTWINASEKLIEFWHTVSSVTISENFYFWWNLMERFGPNIANPEAARRHYSAKQFSMVGAPNVFSPPRPIIDQKYLDPYQILYVYDNGPLKETVKDFINFPLKTSLGEPRLLLISVDVEEGKAVTFDSYLCRTEYGDSEEPIVIEYEEGISSEYLVASTTVPGLNDYTKLKGKRLRNVEGKIEDVAVTRYFWDGRLSSTPLRELVHAHRKYWIDYDNAKEAPDLDLYIIKMETSKVKAPPNPDDDSIRDRQWDIIFNDKTLYDQRIAAVLTDYIDLANELIRFVNELAKYSGLSEKVIQSNIDRILDKRPVSLTHTGRVRTYRELIKGRFDFRKIIQIEGAEDPAGSVSEYDYSRETITQLITRGYQDGQKALIELPSRNIDLRIECGLMQDGMSKKNSSTAETKKIEEEFERAIKPIPDEKMNLNQLKEIAEFVNWCNDKAKRNPDGVISEISNTIFVYMLELLKPYYSNFLLEEIGRTIIQQARQQANSDTQKVFRYIVRNKYFKVGPTKPFIELSVLEDKIKTSSVKFIFKIETDIQVKKSEVLFTLEGVKTFLDSITAGLELLVSELSIDTVSPRSGGKSRHLQELSISLLKRSFNVNDVYKFEIDRSVNAWIKDHKAVDPLEVGVQYELLLNISTRNTDSLSHHTDRNFPSATTEFESRGRFENRGSEITVFASGDAFEVPVTKRKLILPEHGESSTIAINIKPLKTGIQKLQIFFYYELNLLMAVSLPLNIIRPAENVMIEFEERKLLPVDVISSSDKGFESVHEIKRLENE